MRWGRRRLCASGSLSACNYSNQMRRRLCVDNLRNPQGLPTGLTGCRQDMCSTWTQDESVRGHFHFGFPIDHENLL